MISQVVFHCLADASQRCRLVVIAMDVAVLFLHFVPFPRPRLRVRV
jgi:hypothetical protein